MQFEYSTSDAFSEEVPDETRLGVFIANQLFELWIEPELARRGLVVEEQTASVEKALIVFRPGASAPDVRINDEAPLSLIARATRDLDAGEPVRASDIADIERVEPSGIDPNSAWIAFLALPDGRIRIAMDGRRNRAVARGYLARGREYLSAAAQLAEGELIAPAVDALQASYELGVRATKAVFADFDGVHGKTHKAATRWIEGWARQRNVPSEHAKLAGRLVQLRAEARYTGDEVHLSRERLDALLESVSDFLGYADRSTDLPSTDE